MPIIDTTSEDNRVSTSFYPDKFRIHIHLRSNINSFVYFDIDKTTSLKGVRNLLTVFYNLIQSPFLFLSPAGILIDDAQENDILVVHIMEQIPKPDGQFNYILFINKIDQDAI